MKKLLALSLFGAILALPSAPAAADGSFSLYGAYWNTNEADETAGGGITFAFPVSQVLDIELRGAYFEEISDEPFDDLLDDDEVFVNGINVLPIEVGLRFNFQRHAVASPYVAGGVGYYLLDSDFGEVDDEVGFYVALGSSFGDGQGAEFFVEANYRQVEGSVTFDPEDLGDLDDVDLTSDFDTKLDGLGANIGVIWRW